MSFVYTRIESRPTCKCLMVAFSVFTFDVSYQMLQARGAVLHFCSREAPFSARQVVVMQLKVIHRSSAR